MLNNRDTINGPEGDYKVAFKYDEKGNPLNIRFTENINMQEDFEFRHDKKNRVTDVIRAYPNQDRFTSWHRLKYDNQNRIVRDSLYYGGGLIGGVPIADSIIYRTWVMLYTFKYDNYNRIIQETQDANAQGQVIHWIRYYYYGSTGNLDSTVVYSGSPYNYKEVYNSYDTLVNVRRTNPLWQFLDRDYSKNNPIFATSEPNQYGLPGRMVFTRINDDRYTILGLPIKTMAVTYECKGSVYPQ
jgi:hypothetical protein